MKKIAKTELNNLLNILISLGENRTELNFWKDFFDSLDEQEQQKLINNLTNEIKELQQLNETRS